MLKTISAKDIITKGFDISLKKGSIIINYVNQLLKDYPNDPSGALKEIPLNLKKNERHLASFTLGNHYASIFKEFSEEEMKEFLAIIADEIDLGIDRIDIVWSYIITDIIIKMKGEQLTMVIKNILSTTFSEKEKDYILFSYGLISR